MEFIFAGGEQFFKGRMQVIEKPVEIALPQASMSGVVHDIEVEIGPVGKFLRPGSEWTVPPDSARRRLAGGARCVPHPSAVIRPV